MARGFSFDWLRGLTQSDAMEARREATDAKAEVKDLRERVDRLGLLTRAVWSLAAERLGVTDEQLADRVHELDMSDGTLDGRIQATAAPCPRCGRMMSSKRMRCLYCGESRREG